MAKTEIMTTVNPDHVVGEVAIGGGLKHCLTTSEAGRIAARALGAEMKIHVRAERLAAAIAQGFAVMSEIPDSSRLDVLISLRRGGHLPVVVVKSDAKSSK